MKPNLLSRKAWMLLALALSTVPGVSKTPVSDVRVTVLVYDYVNVPTNARTEAASNAGRVFGQAGVAVELIECYSGGIKTGHPGCAGPLGPAVLMLRIIEPKLAEDGKHLGYAAMTHAGGVSITVYLNPAQRRARAGSLSDGALLGHVIAHEIGHLLLGPNSHSSAGIMRPVWRVCDEEWMARGLLQFDGGQAKKMQAALLAGAGR